MSPLWILLLGMVIVVGGVLVLRIHAFLALILGALVVSLLTPRTSIYHHELRTNAVSVVSVDAEDQTVTLGAGSSDGVLVGTIFTVLRLDPADEAYQQVAVLQVERADGNQAVAGLIGVETTFRMAKDDLVILPAQERAAHTVSAQSIGQHVATGFGRTCMSIGILIAMAAIIGKCLLDSGGAERIVLAARRALGEERTPVAFLGSGFLLGIPVFFDTVFYLLVPLAKAMRVRTGKNYVLYILTIVAGASIAHSLVPPTPGPLFVASELDVDIGLMMLGGCAVGLVAIVVGYLYAQWANRRWDIPLRPSAELTLAELEAMNNRDERTLPALGVSLLPILLPVVLIAGNTVLNLVIQDVPSAEIPGWLAGTRSVVNLLGNKNVALVIAGMIALLMLARQKRNSRADLAAAVQVALASGGIIILITAAGGAFGHVLRQTGISSQLQDLIPATQLALLPAAFGITTLVRIAQGSATVAMITAVGIFAPIAAVGGLAFHPLYLALAIGCGSKPYPWMNDSGFWIISTMSGFTEEETLKTASVVISLMGVVGLVVTLLGAWLFPLV